MLLELNKITIKNRVRLQYIVLVITGQSSISVAMSMSTPIHHYNWRDTPTNLCYLVCISIILSGSRFHNNSGAQTTLGLK